MENYPAPQDNRYNCPICGCRPCRDDCGLGLSKWDVELWGDLLAECDPGEYPTQDDGD